MKSQKLRQSKIFVGLNSNRSDILEDDLQYDNPQNNFQKLMSLPHDQPGKEFRNLIQTMSEHCSFQKNLIKKTSHIEVPTYVKSEIKRNEVYRDYEIIKNFTIFSKKKQHFQTRKFNSVSRASSTTSSYQHQEDQKQKSGKNSALSNKKKTKSGKRIVTFNKPISMLQIVEQKKNKMLMEDNVLKTDQNNVQNILNDNKKREKLFQEALLLERLYDIEIEKLKKVGVTETEGQVPQKFRGVDPKHIRISTEVYETEQQYLRKKYVCKKRKLQYYNHARKIEQSSLKGKKKQNLGVLQTLMRYSEANEKRESSTNFIKGSKLNKEMNIFEQDLKIKRLFLKYSNSEAQNPDQMYKYIGNKQLELFFSDFQLIQKRNQNLTLLKYIQRKKDETDKLNRSYFESELKVKFFLFDFLEIIYILASQSNIEKSTCDINPFLNTYIWPKQDKVVPELWIKLKKIKRSQKMMKFLRSIKFFQKMDQLFQKIIRKNVRTYSANPLLSFNDLLEMSWQLKLFPTTISKKVLRFLYLYCKSNENGMSQADFYDLILIIGLKFCEEDTSEKKLNWITNIVQKQSLCQRK